MKFDQLTQDLETTLQILAKDRPDYSGDLESIVRALADVYRQSGNNVKSLEYRKRLLKVAEANANPELVRATCSEILETALKAGDSESALSAYRRIRADFLPPDTMEQARLHLDGASAFYGAGFTDQAVLLYSSVINLVTALPDSETCSIRMNAWQRLVRIYEESEVYDLALDAANNVLSALTEKLGPDHGGLISYLDKVIKLHKLSGKEDEIEALQVERRRLKTLLDG